MKDPEQEKREAGERAYGELAVFTAAQNARDAVQSSIYSFEVARNRAADAKLAMERADRYARQLKWVLGELLEGRATVTWVSADKKFTIELQTPDTGPNASGLDCPSVFVITPPAGGADKRPPPPPNAAHVGSSNQGQVGTPQAIVEASADPGMLDALPGLRGGSL